MLFALVASPGTSAHGLAPSIALHAKLTHADPGIGAVLNSAPSKITLQFGEDVKPAGSDISVFDDKGNKVSDTATVTSSDPKTMTVNMHGDDSETYVVVYRTVSADDGDAYTDAYNFTVSKDATASPGTQPSSTDTSTQPSSGVAPLVAALIGILGLIVGAVGALFFAGRRSVG